MISGGDEIDTWTRSFIIILEHVAGPGLLLLLRSAIRLREAVLCGSFDEFVSLFFIGVLLLVECTFKANAYL